MTSVAQPGAALRFRGAWRNAFVHYVPALAVFVAVIVLWEVLVQALAIRRFILPAPSAIGGAFVENFSTLLLPAARATLIEALGGLVIGTVAGALAGFATARWVTARDSLLPIAITLNSIPIIAFAPLMNNWFGILNPVAKMMIAAVLVFFPIMINVTRGLTQVEPAALELMRSYAASEWTVLRKVRIPNALPYFFTALKVGSTLSLIGAIVGEYFGGSSEVLGRVVVQSASSLNFALTWAAILLAALTGIAVYLAIVYLERRLIPWHASVRAAEGG
ncbi:MAG: ABC transporter permease [Actinomycetota bacterium]|nr:ABC transporter permease [Actinomycetota bacterium]